MNTVKAIVVTHGHLAEAFVKALREIVGKVEDFYALNFEIHENLDDLREELEEIFKKYPNSEFIILVDFLGGSPCNCACHFLSKPKVHVISGVNFPMLVEIATKKSAEDVEKLCEDIVKAGKNSIVDVKKKLASECDL